MVVKDNYTVCINIYILREKNLGITNAVKYLNSTQICYSSTHTSQYLFKQEMALIARDLKMNLNNA